MIDPKFMTDPLESPFRATEGQPLPMRLAIELWDHLWPWSHRGLAHGRGVLALELAVALVASTVWFLAALGHLAAEPLVGWWFAWSLIEVIIRMKSKAYVKEGPWWGQRYRRANLMDMICYVGFKNLLIGSTLFIALKSAGFLYP